MNDTLKEYKSLVQEYTRYRLNQEFQEDKLIDICSIICSILLAWTGNTYIGIKKERNVEIQYQCFFVLLHEFLVFCCSNSDKLSDMERSLARFMMYRGTVYRYLGVADTFNIVKKRKIEPEYNEIYVSWSQTERNSYIESKLYGPMTWLKAEIKAPNFGIYIHGFELWCEKWLGESCFITRGNEKEIVFPTYERCVVQKEYLY